MNFDSSPRSIHQPEMGEREITQIARKSAFVFGFHPSRVSGSHHIFAHEGVRELVNFQEVRGKAKPYQVKQLLDLAERYNLSLEGDK